MKLATKERKWILIVDDEEDIRETIKEIVKLHFNSNVEAVEAKDGVDATSKINYQKFQCIVTDLSMPKKDGESFIRSVRHSNMNSTTPVLILSGRQSKKAISDNFEFVEIMDKPINMQELIKKIELYLKFGDNTGRISSDVFNDLVKAIEKFATELSNNKISQLEGIKLKYCGQDIQYDYASSLLVRIGSVRNTFSILADEAEARKLFKKRINSEDHNIQHLMESMSFVILKHVIDNVQRTSPGKISTSFIRSDKQELSKKKGILLALGNEDLKIRVFASTG